MKQTLMSILSVVFLCLLAACQQTNPYEKIEKVAEQIMIPETLSSDIYLPNHIDGVDITWKSDDLSLLSNTGKINRPANEDGNQTVSLTATFSYGGIVENKVFSITIIRLDLTPLEKIEYVLNDLNFETPIDSSINFAYYIDGVNLSYISSNIHYLLDSGELIKRPAYYLDDLKVYITIIADYQGFVVSENREIIIMKEVYTFENVITGYASLGFDMTFVDENSPNYYKVYNEKDFIEALSHKGDLSANVIEIMADLDLGFHHVKSKYPNASFDSNVFRAHREAIAHPILMTSGVSRIHIRNRKTGTDYKPGLKIFSKTGHRLIHTSFFIKNSENIWIENIEMDELWEYDDTLSYDRNDWDYMTIEDSRYVFINYVTLNQAYDGLIDIRDESSHITITNSRFIAEVNDFIKAQVDYLEANIDQFPTYKNYKERGVSVEEMYMLLSFQKKGHLIGASELQSYNAFYTVTLSNNYYLNVLDRIPRLRGGDVHVYNIIHDASSANEFRNYMIEAYGISFTNQGIVTTENGAVLMENSIFSGINNPIRNNQKGGDPLFTGKFLVLNSTYVLGNYRQTSSSTDLNSIWKSTDAPYISFSFNNYVEIPYAYQLIPVEHLLDYFNNTKIGAHIYE